VHGDEVVQRGGGVHREWCTFTPGVSQLNLLVGTQGASVRRKHVSVRAHGVQPRPDFWVLVQGARPLIVAPTAAPGPHLQVHLEEIVHFDVTGRLHEIRAPTLVVCGAQDPIVPVDRCAAIRDGIPGAELLVLEHTGHGVDNADEADVGVFRTRVRQFLSQVEAGQIA